MAKNQTAPSAEETKEIAVSTDARDVYAAPNELAALSTLENMDDANFVDLNGEYYEMPENATLNIIATGFTEIKSTQEQNAGTMIPCVCFKMKQGGEVKNFISGAAVLVSTVKNLAAKLPDPNNFILGLRVITGQKVKSGSGNKYVSMQIKLLAASAPAPATEEKA